MTPKERCKAKQNVKSERKNWESYWQTVHDKFYLEAEDVNRQFDKVKFGR